MMRVFKYEIPMKDSFELALPRDAKIISFQVQYDKPVIWALVDIEETRKTEREFRLVGTGHPLEKSAVDVFHIGTVQMHMGNLVLHLFEVIRF